MASFDDVQRILLERFETLVATPQALSYEAPNGPALSPAAGTTWARVSFLIAESRLTELGSQTQQIPGIFVVQIFTKLGAGEGTSLALEDEIVQNFRGVTVTDTDVDVMLTSPTPKPIGRDADTGGWWQRNVECNFVATLRS